MFRIQNQQWKDLAIVMILYAAVIIYQGYQYGQSDQSQILPVLYAQDHPDAYPNDHYVNAYLESGFNERTIFHALFSYMGYGNPWLVFLWHAIASIGLILGLKAISKTFIRNTGLQWLVIGLILTIGFHTSTGSNEVYYNQFIPSLPAKALAAWAIYYWIKSKYGWWSVLLIAACLLQPLVGLQVFVITTFAMVANRYLKRASLHHHSVNEKIPLGFILLYILITLPLIVLLAINNGGHQNPDLFMEIMKFRLPHHFYASAFGIRHLMMGLLFAVVCMLFYKEKLRWFFIIGFAGCIVYEIGVEIINSPSILYTQWWKTTIWTEAFAFIAIIRLIEKKIPYLERDHSLSFLIPVSLLLLIAVYRLSGIFGEKPLYLLPGVKKITDEIDISIKAEKLTPAGSLFIIPTEISAFRWYSKRDNHIDYKAMIHNEAFLTDWYDRMKSIYKYDLTNKEAGLRIHDVSKQVLNNPATESLSEWEQEGIDYIITTSEIPRAELVSNNRSYFLYKIPKN